MASRWGAPLADLLAFALPQRCPGCGEPAPAATLFCGPCAARWPAAGPPVCARCLRDGAPPDGCSRHPDDRVQAGWLYDEAVARLAHAIKFEGRPALVHLVAAPLAEAVRAGGGRTDLVVAVPLHAARRRERGYDQAARLAEALAAELGAPFVPGVLERTRATRAQSALAAGARRENVRGAFRLARPAGLRGRRVLVVDDVLTTGATLVECMEVLRAAGARTRGAVLAWAP